MVLLREGEAGLEAWLLTRVTGMVFAGGMSVFPGGRVDDDDADLPFAGDGAARAAARFGCDERTARALLGAAVRETFEEAGVLLGVPIVDLADAREDVEAGRVGFGDLLREHGVAVDSDALRPWSRWITPPGEVRRYDTRFFVGALPADAQAIDATTESSPPVGCRSARHSSRRSAASAPCCHPPWRPWPRSSASTTVDAALAAAEERPLDPVEPKVRREGDAFIAELPDGTSFQLPASLFR